MAVVDLQRNVSGTLILARWDTVNNHSLFTRLKSAVQLIFPKREAAPPVWKSDWSEQGWVPLQFLHRQCQGRELGLCIFLWIILLESRRLNATWWCPALHLNQVGFMLYSGGVKVVSSILWLFSRCFVSTSACHAAGFVLRWVSYWWRQQIAGIWSWI